MNENRDANLYFNKPVSSFSTWPTNMPPLNPDTTLLYFWPISHQCFTSVKVHYVSSNANKAKQTFFADLPSSYETWNLCDGEKLTIQRTTASVHCYLYSWITDSQCQLGNMWGLLFQYNRHISRVIEKIKLFVAHDFQREKKHRLTEM